MNSILKKMLTAVSGLLLVGFLITHLAANLTLLSPDGEAFNTYVAHLHAFGPWLTLAELGLLALFGLHIVNGLLLKRNHMAARPQRYRVWKSKGAPSKANWSSMTMAISGLFLLAFLIVHVSGLRFGPNIAEGYITQIGGVQERDLHRLVLEKFSNPGLVAFYILATLTLGSHLKHGFWSAFQSLGVSRPSIQRVLQGMSVFVAILFAVGFLILPLILYIRTLG